MSLIKISPQGWLDFDQVLEAIINVKQYVWIVLQATIHF